VKLLAIFTASYNFEVEKAYEGTQMEMQVIHPKRKHAVVPSFYTYFINY